LWMLMASNASLAMITQIQSFSHEKNGVGVDV